MLPALKDSYLRRLAAEQRALARIIALEWAKIYADLKIQVGDWKRGEQPPIEQAANAPAPAQHSSSNIQIRGSSGQIYRMVSPMEMMDAMAARSA